MSEGWKIEENREKDEENFEKIISSGPRNRVEAGLKNKLGINGNVPEGWKNTNSRLKLIGVAITGPTMLGEITEKETITIGFGETRPNTVG